MSRKILKKKPLVEAIFEIRWNLKESKPSFEIRTENGKIREMRIDPNYKLLVGRLYDKVFEDYPFHEQLPASSMPDEISEYVIQHRFRKAEGGWPLIQLGPGILTLNDTESYVWEDFIERIEKILKIFYDLYSKSEEDLIINRLMLRYIDAVDFDYENSYIFDFLKDYLKIEIKLIDKLFDNTNIEKKPNNFELKFHFKSEKPKGIISLRFGRGYKKEEAKHAILWETVFLTEKNDVPTDKTEVIDWVKGAHLLIDDWFFKLIEGELEKRFE